MTTIINENQFLEKISRLNNSQQSIESLSNWCTFYRKVTWHLIFLHITEWLNLHGSLSS